MVDNEKQENLANARRKLKIFRDQNQLNATQPNGTDTSFESSVSYNSISQINGIRQNSSKSPIVELDEKTRPFAKLTENSKQELKNERRSSGESKTSVSSNQILTKTTEEKLRRDVEHLQEQLEIHVQTIGIIVAEKTDTAAKLTQSFKQLERKQNEMDELYGRLKASRERVQELEKQLQNSTSNIQKREMAAKESDKENDRLKIENIRQSQYIEDFKKTINELNEKIHQLETKNQQSQSSNENLSITEEQLQLTIQRLRLDNEQYQQYNTNMQHHIQELTNQTNHLTQTNNDLKTQYDILKKDCQNQISNPNFSIEYENFQQENQLLRNAIDQWSNRYEELRIKLEQMTNLLKEKDEQLKIDNSFDQNHLIEIQQELNKKSNENTNLLKQIENVQEINKELNERFEKFQTNTENEQFQSTEEENQQELVKRLDETIRENFELKNRTQQLEHVILQLQSETETIGDYIHLYQQQREQLQRRYQEKDDLIQQLTNDRIDLQKNILQLETLLVQFVNIPIESNSQEEKTIDENSNLSSLPQLNDEMKQRLLILIKKLEENNKKLTSKNDKFAFVNTNFHICSTCSGPVHWV